MAAGQTTRMRIAGQTLVLLAALAVLVVISTASVLAIRQAREDSAWVVHTLEVENQLNALQLDVRRAESAVRAYLLTTNSNFLADYEANAGRVIPDFEKLAKLGLDNSRQAEPIRQLKSALDDRLKEFERAADFVKRNDISGGVAMLKTSSGDAVKRIGDITTAMHAEEDRLFIARTASADASQKLAIIITIIGSSLVVALAGISVWLVRRSTMARDIAEQQLQSLNVNLEGTVEERTADLREANEEIQRFAYIVSHDLRSPLVNIMGFTSELEELRGDIFRRIATLAQPSSEALDAAVTEPVLEGDDKQLSADFSEALGFIKSSIAKMDRLISAILQLTREGRREFKPNKIDTTALIETIAATVAHQASEAGATIKVEKIPDIVSDRLALEQIFSNLIDNAVKYLRIGVPGEISISGRARLGFAIFDVSDNGRGIDSKDHKRIFDLFRRAGSQDRPGQGIGLAHVRALVRRLGGTLSVSSELHKGSTFTVTLPATWTLKDQGRDA